MRRGIGVDDQDAVASLPFPRIKLWRSDLDHVSVLERGTHIGAGVRIE